MKRLEDELYKYAQSDFYPFHMPGHKRQGEGDGALSEICKMDITEIDGFDDLHHAEGILLDLMREMSGVYGTRRTYISVNGSTAGILSAICAVTDEGDSVLVARNCHKSVLNACFLKSLDVSYVMPEQMDGVEIYGGVQAENVEQILADKPGIKAVIITSPTYEGVVSDVQKIADVAHAHGAVLIVDEAHGAHLPFILAPAFPKSALECGADLVIQSLHKTLPAMTQTAVLHVNSERVDTAKVERYLSIFISSSPSYVLIASASRCFHFMCTEGREKMRKYEARLLALREELKKLNHIRLLGKETVGKYGVFDYDIGKLVLVCGDTDLSGRELADILRSRYHIEIEMSAPGYVICMTSLMDTDEGFQRLAAALCEIDEEVAEKCVDADDMREKCGREIKAAKNVKDENKKEMITTAMLSVTAQSLPGICIKIEESLGRVSKETLYVYPPGSPIIVAGEVITRQVLDKIEEYKAHGFKVHGLSKEGHILVVKEEK